MRTSVVFHLRGNKDIVVIGIVGALVTFFAWVLGW